MALVGLWVLLAEAHAQPLVPEANSGSLRALMFHVHKAGGTTLCHMAKRNGERTSSNNCNVGEKGTPFCWACDREKAAALSSEEEASYLSSAPYTFGANECLAPPPHISRAPEAGVLTLTALREPLGEVQVEGGAQAVALSLSRRWRRRQPPSLPLLRHVLI